MAEYQIEEIYAKKYNTVTTSRKDIGDIYVDNIPINIKSNNVDKNNYSPNMVSAKKIHDYLSIPTNKLKFLFVSYNLIKNNINIIKEELVNVEHISWECLTIQCQGLGVIQMNKSLKVNKKQTREEWLEHLKINYLRYIERERNKLNKLEKMVEDNG
jgi:hypothetical protein